MRRGWDGEARISGRNGERERRKNPTDSVFCEHDCELHCRLRPRTDSRKVSENLQEVLHTEISKRHTERDIPKYRNRMEVAPRGIVTDVCISSGMIG